MIKRILIFALLCGSAFAQFTTQGNSTVQGQFVSPAPAGSGGIIVPPSLFGMHIHNPQSTWSTVPTSLVRIWGTSSQWNSIETSAGNYNWNGMHQWYNLAVLNNDNLMYTVGQLPLFYSTHNPDPGAFGLVTMARTGCPGSCVVTFTSDARMNAANSDSLTFSGVTCTDGDNLTAGPYTVTGVSNGIDYPWTYTIAEGTTNATCSGGTVTDTNLTATRCGATPAGSSPGSCYSPSNISITGVVTGIDPIIPFVNALIADDIANDPQHRLTDLECWNEPQGPGFWNSSLSQLGQMCADLYATVKASPESYIRVHAPPPSSGAVNIQNWIAGYAAKAGNYYQYADVLGYHTYSYGPTNAPLADDVLTIATDANISFAGCANCSGKPVWATEGGWGAPTWATTGVQGPCFLNSSGGIACKDAGGNYADKAGYVAQSYALHATAGIVDFNWFAWDQCANSGLMTNCPPASQVIGGSGLAYGYIHDWLANANLSTPCAVAANHWTCFITRSGGYSAELVWDRIDAPAAFTPSATYTQYRDLAGNVVLRAAWTASGCGGSAGQLCYQYDPLLLESGNQAFQVTNSPSGGVQGQPYSWTLTAVGNSGPLFCDERTLPSALPTGLSFGAPNANTCQIVGTPSVGGTFPGIILGVEDSMGNSTSATFSITIGSAPTSGENKYCSLGDLCNFGPNDGPAQLPQTGIYTGRNGSPQNPGGTIRNAANSAAFTSALAASACGDTIQLTAGAVYQGNFTIPNITCVGTQYWLLITTANWATAGPPEGTRVDPCYAGQTSLPGQPDVVLTCPSGSSNRMAQITTGSVAAPIILAGGANHIRIEGVEVTRNTGLSGSVSILVDRGNCGTTPCNHFILDQVWGHGTQNDETVRMMSFDGITYAAAVNGFYSDFHCMSISGTCGDSQTFSGGINNIATTACADHAWKHYNNFLESAGETFEYGGGGGQTTPCDIEDRSNYMFKSLAWDPIDPSYIAPTGGHPWIVKNHWEAKNATRVLIEGNVIQNVWAGFTQVGSAILFTPKSQSAGSNVPGLCPLCFVSNITFRYNWENSAAQALQIGNVGSAPCSANCYAQGGNSYSIHDNVFDNLGFTSGQGALGSSQPTDMWQGATDLGAPSNDILHDISVFHNTFVYAAVTNGTWPLATYNLDGPVTGLFNRTNKDNIIASGSFGINTAYSGTSRCGWDPTGGGGGTGGQYSLNSNGGEPAWLVSCWTGVVVSDYNCIVGGHSNATWIWNGTHNQFPTNYAGVNFTSYNNGNFGNYVLQGSSACHAAADDGLDMGASISTVNTYILGVRQF